MDIPTPIENRLVDLEIKAGFTEDLLDQLSAQVYRQQQQIDALIQEMQLGRKVHLEGDHFSTLDLSTGQRKRLALIVALMDNRPIFLFDELAADQDPEFRAYLYTVLLPRLRSEGRLVIAATHDDIGVAGPNLVMGAS